MNNGINVPCTLVSMTSKEGKPFLCLSIMIDEENGCEKIVFLDRAELALIKRVFADNKTTTKLNINKSTSEAN